jgi:hypothetical protein
VSLKGLCADGRVAGGPGALYPDEMLGNRHKECVLIAVSPGMHEIRGTFASPHFECSRMNAQAPQSAR